MLGLGGRVRVGRARGAPRPAPPKPLAAHALEQDQGVLDLLLLRVQQGGGGPPRDKTGEGIESEKGGCENSWPCFCLWANTMFGLYLKSEEPLG